MIMLYANLVPRPQRPTPPPFPVPVEGGEEGGGGGGGGGASGHSLAGHETMHACPHQI